ncbi:LysR family transcriptional regulator [Jiangella anatolica]|uniref:LysR family transcriptional regulator n=1 Tax=Jiangella anatolica TaxID=2670374 RepID=A0A2W2B1M8_9ACTN|nr:LysR substrate-binding domain-containing protein [Jiangella anatolica]PZF81331.1 LysR family transcriptional regulator [Jiangella anatolica]
MELRQLAYFVAVADEGGFARAAETLRVGQPAVSQQLRKLERELGVTLFERTTRRVRLSAAGDRLLAEARAVLAAAERTRRLAAELAGAGALRLGTSPAPGRWLPDLLAALATRAPELRVQLSTVRLADRLDAVRSGGLDAALVRDVATAPGLELLELWTDPVVVALPAGHPLAAHETVELSDLGALPVRLAEPRANPPFHRLMTTAFQAAGVDPPAGRPFTSLRETLADLAHATPSWTPFYEVGPPPPMPGVAYRRLASLVSTTYLAVPAGPPPAPIRLLLAAARDLTPGGVPRRSAGTPGSSRR